MNLSFVNFSVQQTNEDKLFNLFSLYGNIVRIKVLRNKPDHALVEMADGFQSELAVHYLKVSVFSLVSTYEVYLFHFVCNIPFFVNHIV
jgi:hypothetical protein